MGPYYQAFPEGGSLTIYEDDPQRTYDSIAKWSKADAEAMPEWDAWLAGLADVLGPLLLTVPPTIGAHSPGDLKDTLRLAWRHRGLDVRTIGDVTRLMAMSICGPAGRLVRVARSRERSRSTASSARGPAPSSPARRTSWRTTRSVTWATGSWAAGAFPRAAWARVSAAIRRSAAGVRCRGADATPASSRCSSTNGRVTGVVLEDGTSSARRSSSRACTRDSPSSSRCRRATCPTTFVRDIERGRPAAGS